MSSVSKLSDTPVILVVDDGDSFRYARSRILSQAGYQVIEASTGEEALLMAASHQPYVIVLDVNLPGIDGLEVCRRLKSEENTSHIMVLQVSSVRTSKLDLTAGLEGGADSYLVEPIEPLELLATVKALLRLADREKRVRRVEQQFAEATDAADCGLWDWDIQTGTLQWFGAHERLAGLAPGGFSGKIDAFSDILHPDDRTRVWDKLQGMMTAREEHFADEYRFVHPDDTVHWMTAKGRFFYDDAGRAVRMTGVVQDVTDRKLAAEAVNKSEDQLRRLLDALHVFVGVLTPDGVMVQCNTTPIAAAGLRRDTVIGTHFADSYWWNYSEASNRRIRRDIERAARGEQIRYDAPVRVRNAKGEEVFIDVDFALTPMFDETGAVTHIISIGVNISDRTRAETELRESEQRLRLATEATALGVWEWNVTTNQIHWDAQMFRLYGAAPTPDGIVPYATWSKAVVPEDLSEQERIFQHTIQQRGSSRQTFRIRRYSDGKERHIEAIETVRLNEKGEVEWVVGTNIDVTEHTHAQNALRAAHDTFRHLVQQSPFGVYVVDADFRLVQISAGAQKVFQNVRPLLGRDFADVLRQIWPEPFASEAVSLFRHTLETGEPYHRPNTVEQRRDSGEQESYDWKIERIRLPDGRWGVVCHFYDLSERHRLETALQESESFYRQTLESIPGMAFTNRPDGSCDYVSQQWVDFTGIPASEQLGSGWVQTLHPDDRERAFAAWRAAVEGRGQYDLEYRVRRHDGQYRWFKVRGRAIRDEDGTIVRWFGSAVNVDDLKRTEAALRENEAQLRQWKDTLEVRVRERTGELLATQERLMTVTSQLSLTEQKERRKLARDLHDYLAQMLVVGQMKTKMLKKHLSSNPTGTTFVQDLDKMFHQALSYTRTLIAELSPPSLHESGLAAALKWLAERFEKDGLRVSVRVDCDAVPLPEEQAVVVFQAVRELLFNVLKHAGVDQATVTVTFNDGEILHVAVADKGKGLSLNATQQTAEPGHLGLISVRERFQAMGGRVEVVSMPGHGTTVTLVLPLIGQNGREERNKRDEPTSASQPISPLSPSSRVSQQATIRVLLVDDQQLVRQGLKDILAGEDRIRVVGEAENGVEALMLAANVVPDVVILDVNLPDIDAVEATKRLKRLHPQMRVIGFSCRTDQHVARDMVAAGAEALLSEGGAAEELTAAIIKSYSERAMVPQ